jgi:hypothetical protein
VLHHGQGRVLEWVAETFPNVVQIAALIKNPANFPAIAFEQLVQDGTLDRLGDFALKKIQSGLDWAMGVEQPKLRAIGPIDYQERFDQPLLVEYSSDAVAAHTNRDLIALNPANDGENRPETGLIEYAQTTAINAANQKLSDVQDAAANALGEAAGDLVQEAIVNVGAKIQEVVPFDVTGLPDISGQASKIVQDSVTRAANPRFQIAEARAESKHADPLLESKYDIAEEPLELEPMSDEDALLPQAPPTTTATTTATTTTGSFTVKPSASASAPPFPRTTATSSTTGRATFKLPNFDANRNFFKRKSKRQNTFKRLPPQQRSDVILVDGAEDNDFDVPLRPEVRRAGLDSLKWPTRQQVSEKLDESLYYRDIHEDRGSMRDNPLIKQSVLENEIRFRRTDPPPQVPYQPPEPTQKQKEMLQATLFATFNENSLRLNRYVADQQFLATPLQTVRNELHVPKYDAYVPAEIQCGGRPYTQASRFTNLR